MATSRSTARQVLLIDCGSSAVRAYVAEVGPGKRSAILEDLSRDIDLTEGLRGGRLSRAAMNAVEEAVRDILASAASYGAEIGRAVGTASLREAINSDVLVERLRVQCGIALEVIDTAEETRLYYEALRQLQQRCKHRLSGGAMLMDVGSGTSALGLIKGGKLVHAVDEHFGTDRLLHAFRSLRDATSFSSAIDRVTAGAVSMILSRLPKARIRNLVVTGDEIRDLALRLAPGDVGEMVSVPLTEIEAWWQSVAGLTPAARAAACNCSLFEGSQLLMAAALLRHLALQTGNDEVLVPRLRLRDGMLADCLPGAQGPHHLGRNQLLGAAAELARRYGMDLPYAENTASLAAQIFDQSTELHHLGERERTLLEFAAWVHDVGASINVRGRHKHSYYMIQALDIAGLSAEEKSVVAHVARYHRRSTPKISHAAFQRLPRTTRVVISHLAAILRIAYALDVERTQRIRSVHCQLTEDALVIGVDRRDIALERWAVSDKSAMFADVFGLDVKLRPLGDT